MCSYCVRLEICNRFVACGIGCSGLFMKTMSFPLSFEKELPNRSLKGLPAPPSPACQTQMTAEPSELRIVLGFSG